ncbi:MAG: PPOX class F420-dependent oxidoreductase, partial [Actinomycetota bacterium]|nr:PPOX class F420-dependent oxidoreductase [Actinomycetota bacterium]
MHIMDRDEWLAFANEGTRTGKVATVRADGAAHVVPIWFLIDDSTGVDRIVFNTGAESTKGKALRRDPRFSLCVDLEVAPYSFVMFQAEAELSDDLGAVKEWAGRLGARYMGPERADEFAERNAVTGE